MFHEGVDDEPLVFQLEFINGRSLVDEVTLVNARAELSRQLFDLAIQEEGLIEIVFYRSGAHEGTRSLRVALAKDHKEVTQ